jgi:hypothetical protein
MKILGALVLGIGIAMVGFTAGRIQRIYELDDPFERYQVVGWAAMSLAMVLAGLLMVAARRTRRPDRAAGDAAEREDAAADAEAHAPPGAADEDED